MAVGRKGLKGGSAYTAGGRIGGKEPRISRLQLLKPSEETVILGIGNGRRIKYVVAMAMASNFPPQTLDFFFYRHILFVGLNKFFIGAVVGFLYVVRKEAGRNLPHIAVIGNTFAADPFSAARLV